MKFHNRAHRLIGLALLLVVGLMAIVGGRLRAASARLQAESAFLPYVTNVGEDDFNTSASDLCGIFFAQPPVEGHNFVYVTGEIGIEVTITNASTGATLGTDVLIDVPGKRCPGFADFSPPNNLNQTLVAGDTLVAVPNDASEQATAMVVAATATPTVTPTPTDTNTPAPTVTPSITATPTPGAPQLTVIPTCGNGPDVSFALIGWNWPTDEPIALFWDDSLGFQIPAGHSGSFNYNWTKQNVSDGAHVVEAISSSASDTADFLVPCPSPPTTTPGPSLTPTPTRDVDLAILSTPALLSTPPIVAYQPVDVAVILYNVGDEDVTDLFFVDLFLDLDPPITDTWSLTQSDGYMAVSGIPGGAVRIITVTVPHGFENTADLNQMVAVADSARQIGETDEENNISPPGLVPVTPGPTPTPSPTSTPVAETYAISGVIYARHGHWQSQPRAQIYLFNDGTGEQVGTTQSDVNGFYEFLAPAGEYTVRACVQVDQVSYSGIRDGLTPPDPYADLFLLKGPCP